MQSVVSEGKDLKSAIENGLNILGALEEEVSIEVIQSQSKGLLGIGSKNAIVQLTKKSSTIQIDLKESIPIEQIASSALEEDQTKEEKAVLTDIDMNQIKIEKSEQETKWNVNMDPHQLWVRLHVEPGYKLTKYIPEIQEKHRQNLVEEKEVCNTLTYKEIKDKLDSLKVTIGINELEIKKAIEATEAGVFEIASGVKPIPGKDGWLELKFNTETQKRPKEKENGIVDFREIKIIPAISKGNVMAIVHSPVAGRDGYTVTNEVLPAKPTYPLTIKTGNGAIVVDNIIEATESGRPLIEQRGQLVKVSIMPKLTHQGNVDLSTGNIHFMGDVEILGEVKDRMVVEAEGDLTVHKTTSMANLIASGAIIAKSTIIGSDVTSGKNNMYVAELIQLLDVLNQEMEKMVDAISQLTKVNDFTKVGIQPLIKLLLEKKFNHFSFNAKKYVEVVKNSETHLVNADWREISDSLIRIFLSLSNQIISLNMITQLSQKMKELLELNSKPTEPISYITVPNALNSTLYCSGNITILGQGCINSKIHSGGILKITGVIRGGSVFGSLGVEINEAGSESGAPTLIGVPGDQKIIINKVMEGTTIQIGNTKYTFDKTAHQVKGRLNENGKIIFE